jgi:hypothetical protein
MPSGDAVEKIERSDNTNIFISAKNIDNLKTLMISALKDVFTWCRDNFLTINSDKTCYTLFSGGKKTIHDQLNNIKVGDSVIKRVKSATYLGVTLDENLSWSDHINKLCNSLTKIGMHLKLLKIAYQIKTKCSCIMLTFTLTFSME